MSSKQRAVMIDTTTEQFVAASQVKQFPITDTLAIAVEFVFGCWHRKLSRPFTMSGWTYEVCLNCGRKFAYTRADIA